MFFGLRFLCAILLVSLNTALQSAPLARVIDAREFSATGDYSTDDTSAIQAAIDSTDPVWGGSVFLPAGGYRLTRSLIISHPHVSLIGAGGSTSQIIVNDQTFDIVVIKASNSILLSKLWINVYGHTQGQKWAVYDGGRSANLVLQDIEISGSHSGIYSTGGASYFQHIKLLHLAALDGVGIEFGGASEIHDLTGIYMENAPSSQAGAGLKIDAGADVTLIDAQIQAMGIPLLVKPSSGAVFSVNITSSWFDSSSGPAALFDGSTGTIQRISISGCWFGGSEYGVKVTGAVWGLHMQNSEIVNNRADGIYVSSGTVLRAARFDSVQVAGNHGFGFHVGSNVSEWSISNSTIGAWADFHANGQAILIEKGASNLYSITGNRIQDSAENALVDFGTGKNKVIGNNLFSEWKRIVK